MRGDPCRNCDRWSTSEYRDELGDYYCDECYAFALYELELELGTQQGADAG